MAQGDPVLKVPKKDYRKGDLPETKEEWVRYINKLHDAGLQSRRRYEFQWVVNLAYFQGFQHLLFNSRTGTLEMPRDLRSPLIINRIASFVESRHAKITKNSPMARVIPSTNDIEDVRGAENADRALKYLWRKIGMDRKLDTLTMLMLITGTAFMENLWDPRSGESIKKYAKGKTGEEMIFSEDGGEVEKEEIFLGEVSTTPLSPFAIIPANDAIPEVMDQPYLIKRTQMSLLEIEDLYPHLRGKVQKRSEGESRTEHEKVAQRLSSQIFAATGQSELGDVTHHGDCVKTFMMRPNYQYEGGVFAVVIGDQLAMIDAFPNDYGDNVYPIVKFSEKVNGFHFWNQATVERLIPVQRAFNRLRQQKAKSAALMANPKWMLPKGSQVSSEALNDEEGEVVEYNPAVAEPHAAVLSPMPAYVSELARDLIVDFRDVGGQRESSVTPPPNVTAGVAMSMAAELADEILGPLIRRYAESLEIVSNQQLLLMDQEYQDPRKVKVLGEGGRVRVLWLSNVDFRNSTDVHVEIESMLPDLRGGKRQVLLDLWDRRIIQDPEEFLRVFMFGNWDLLLEERRAQEDAIELDIARLKKGKAPEMSPTQNHMMYVEKLNKWIQTPDFLRLIPERKQLVIQVLQAHAQMIMQQMPNGGEPMPQTNQAAVGTPFGPAKPVGAPGSPGAA